MIFVFVFSKADLPTSMKLDRIIEFMK